LTGYRVAAAARADIDEILAWTEDHFGDIVRRRYEILLVTSFRDLAADPERTGSISRPELGTGLRSYHLRYSRERARTAGGLIRRPRHLLLYEVMTTGLVGIDRVLHDSMEVERHLPADFGFAPDDR
jgi:toxin ParE1/3/4